MEPAEQTVVCSKFSECKTTDYSDVSFYSALKSVMQLLLKINDSGSNKIKDMIVFISEFTEF